MKDAREALLGYKGWHGDLDPLLTRTLVAGAVTLSLAGAISPAFAQSTDRSPNMPDNVRFSNPDTMQKPPGYSHVVEVTGPGRTVYFAGQLGIDKSGRMGANVREQTEIAFENQVECDHALGFFSNSMPGKKLGEKVARFRQVKKEQPHVHHDALEFPSGQIVLLTCLYQGQQATVLQLPTAPRTEEEAEEQKRVAVVA